MERRGKNGVRMERIVRNESTTMFLYSLNCVCKSAIIVLGLVIFQLFQRSFMFRIFRYSVLVPRSPFLIVLTAVNIESGLRRRLFVDERLKLKCYRPILRVIAFQNPSTTAHGLSQPRHRVRGDGLLLVNLVHLNFNTYQIQCCDIETVAVWKIQLICSKKDTE